MKKLAYIFCLIGILVFGLTACDEAEISRVEEDQTETDESNNAEENNAGPEIFAIGDTVQFNDLKVTLVGVREVQDEYFNPDNDKFVAVELHIENTGSESENISTLMQMKFLADGYEQDQTIVDVKGSLDGEVGAGRTMKGEVAFDIEEAETYEFIFEDPFVNGQAIWEFTNADITQ